jgi:putative PIN family toxin of toxin-antitoxin system
MRVILDTNIIYSGLRSDQGASYRILDSLPSTSFQIVLGATLLLEYEDVLKRPDNQLVFSHPEIDLILDTLVSIAHLQKIHFHWRPCLRDPKDDHILELAVAAGCQHVVTFNTKDFAQAKPFGIQPIRPGQFLEFLGGQS